MSDPGQLVGGRPAKVTHCDRVLDRVVFRYENGDAGFLSDSGAAGRFAVGDILVVDGNLLYQAPEEVWMPSTTVGVVREFLEGGQVVVESAYSLTVLDNVGNLELKPGNTVEFSATDGIIRVISQHEIRSTPPGESISSSADEFRMSPEDNNATFEDFGGYREVRERARELIETQLSRGGRMREIGAKPVRGVLFAGPPGTGKTHLARIVARESGADFFLVSGPTIISKWVGDTERTLRSIFQAAAESEVGKAIIFFDEIDSMAERRDGDSHESSRRLVAQMLTLMDGFLAAEGNVVVIAATNRKDVLDPALLRPGRFDWEICFDLPDREERREILAVGARHLTVDGFLPIDRLAELTDSWSGAQLSAIWTESALLAADEDRGHIREEDVLVAYERVHARFARGTLGVGGTVGI